MVAWLPGTYHVPAVGNSTPSIRWRRADLGVVLLCLVTDSLMLKILATSEAVAVSRWYSIFDRSTFVAGSGNPMLNWPMTAAAETTNVLTEAARRLRTLRTERRMTLIELSKATGISR